VAIACIVFDVGETLINEERMWGFWADRLGVTRLRFFAAMGAVLDRGQHHRRAFDLVAPGFDLAAARRELATGEGDRFDARDLYPDALPALRELREAGFRIGIAGNQPESAEAALRDCGFEADFIASSARWGVEKPSPAFFTKVVEAAGMPAKQVAYVGDHLDNDVLPARAAGMTAVFIDRGPWAVVAKGRPELKAALARIESLREIRRLFVAS
jgi:HAD superfamily hydrolase (TIGR01549 family)